MPRPGSDVMERSPITNWILSRMLMSPKPRPLKALCWSNPTPWSLIRELNLRRSALEFDPEVPHTAVLDRILQGLL